jgi:hypothetical protein
MMRENSQACFDELKESGVLSRLELAVFAAVCEIGPVHNLRLLEYLQQRELVNRKKHERIEWTVSNCWPRVTALVGKGHLRDLGTYRIPWHGRTKTLHVWAIKYDSPPVDAGWEQVESAKVKGAKVKEERKKAADSARCKSSQAGRTLQACRKTKRKKASNQRMLFDADDRQ